MSIIFHITDRESWERARSVGRLHADSLAIEGFIHCSTVRQVVDTANRFFAGQSDLLLLCIDDSKTDAAIEYESPIGHVRDPGLGALFPHLYGPLNLDAVVRAVPFAARPDGTFELPAALYSLVESLA